MVCRLLMARLSSDATLLARTAEGDGAAFQQLLQRHSQSVLNVIYRIVLSRADAEDLCQEVFVRLWKQAPGWQDDAKLSTWLHRVASNLAINHCQRFQRRHVVDAELAECLSEEAEGRGDDAYARQAEPLRESLAQLSEEQRAALAFRYYRELPVKEIAKILDSTPKAVESLLGRARKQLREVLGKRDD